MVLVPCTTTIATLCVRRLSAKAYKYQLSGQRAKRWQSSSPGSKGSTAVESQSVTATTTKPSFWYNAELWGFVTASAGWTMSLSAISDALTKGPELISLPMTSVLVVYSSLFLRWSFVVKPRNLFLAGCHFTNVCAQLNQGRRAIEYKLANNQQDQVEDFAKKAGMFGAMMGGSILAARPLRAALAQSAEYLGPISRFAASDAGPFSTHFWAPFSKWFISGASLIEYDRPVDQISLSQYASLSLVGILSAWYALTVTPVNYMLCSVNVALFLSSNWHLGRKIKADYLDEPKESRTVSIE